MKMTMMKRTKTIIKKSKTMKKKYKVKWNY